MRKRRMRGTALLGVAFMLSAASPVSAGHIVVDVADRHVLEASGADAAIDLGRAADLLLVAVLCERIAAGELSPTARVPVLTVAGDHGPRLSTHEPMEVGELLQLLLLSDSRTAAKTLAWAAGPSIGRALTRMHEMGTRLGFRRTTIADDWPFATGLATGGPAGRRGQTTARELGRLALMVASDAEIRRRLTLDGVPIANGGLIVRATDPLIAMETDAAPAATSTTARGPQIAIAERDGLALLVVATGPQASEELAATLERGFRRYRRVEVVHAGQTVGPSVRVRGGIIPSFNAVAAEPWEMTTPTASPASIELHLQLPAEIDAPVEVHQPLGELVVERAGRILAVIPLVAPKAIAPSGWLDTARQSKAR